MPDYSNTTGRTYVNASGSVRLNNSILAVRKIKPAKTSRDTQLVWKYGSPKPQAHARGKEDIEKGTITVSLYEWQLFTTANPNWKDQYFQIVATSTEPTLGAFSYNHKNALITSEGPSEGDGATTGEALVDLEFLPIAVDHAGKSGSAQT